MDITDKEIHEKVKGILLEMGEFFQIQVNEGVRFCLRA